MKEFTVWGMHHWSLTLHGPGGILSQSDSPEAQFVLGTEVAPDVLQVSAEGVAPRHAWVWIGENSLQVEDLAGGTLVNGHPIEGRVEAEYPSSVQVGSVTLVVERKAVTAEPSVEVTIPQRTPTKNASSTDLTIPQATPNRGATLVAASQAESSGGDEASTHCKYTLVKEIARGGMGQIYFGEDAQLRRQVAVKVSSISEGGEDPRFSKEAEVLAHLAHPNIVPIYAIGVDSQGRPFYAMKLVKGRTLQAVLNAIREGDATVVKEYSRATLLTIFRKVCDAMAFAHAKGVLHRDLKPENIMVGEYGEVLVMDWGLAKVLGGAHVLGGTDVLGGADVLGGEEAIGERNAPAKDTGDYGMTLEGEVMGTPQYMSPEQAEGMVAELDARSDIYSLGGILYAILTLRPPIDGKTLNEVLTKVKRGEISSMATKRGGKNHVSVGTPVAMGVEVPEALQAVTLKAMATDRTKRYAIVENFASDIEAYQNGFATSAENAGALRQLALFIKRNKGVAAAVVVLLASGIAFTLRLAVSERQAREHEQKAVAQGEAARRSLARAQIALADAADVACDSNAISRALSEVPTDLRTPDWFYFQERIDAATWNFPSPAGKSWLAIEDSPSDPDRILAWQNDRQLFAVNLKTGGLEPKFTPRFGGAASSCLAVSKDGKYVAFGEIASALRVHVFQMEDGKLVSDFDTVGDAGGRYGLVTMKITDELVVLARSTKARGYVVEVWNYKNKTLLWSADAFTAELSQDDQSVFLINRNGAAEKREALTGRSLAKGPDRAVVFPGNNWFNGRGTEDWKLFFSPEGGISKVRCLDPWNGRIEFEMLFSNRNFGATVLKNSKRFVSLGYLSSEGSVLEIRESNGTLLRRYGLPVSEGMTLSGDGIADLRAKEDAIVLKFEHHLKVWRLDSARPIVASTSGYGCTRLGDSKQFVQAGLNPDKTLRIHDGLEKDPQRRVLENLPFKSSEFQGQFLIASISRDGRRIAYGNYGKLTAAQREEGGFRVLWEPKTVRGSFCIHPTKDLLWTGGAVWEFSTGRELASVERKDLKENFSFKVNPVSVCWAGPDCVAELTVSKGELARDAGGPEEASKNSLHLAVWSAESGKLLARKAAQNASCLCASPDGALIAEGGVDKRVRIRGVQTLEVEREFRVHQSALTAVAWHPTLPLLVTASKDSTVRVWDLPSLKMVEEFTLNPDRSLGVEISPDGLELTVYGGAMGVAMYQPKSFRP